jgi:hypothetical protein
MWAPIDRSVFIGLFVFLLMRVVVIYCYGPTEIPSGDDHGVYFSMAQKMANDSTQWMSGGSELGYRAPLYFVFLAAIITLTSIDSFVIGQLSTVLLSLINVLLIYQIVWHLNKGASRFAFWIRGLAPLYIILDTFVLTETFYASCLLLSLLLFIQIEIEANKRRLFILGMAVGACVLTREVAMLLPILFIIFIVSLPGQLKDHAVRVGVFSLAVGLIVSPWLIRNEQVWQQPFPISYSSGENLHIGAHLNADGKWAKLPLPSDGSVVFGTPEADDWHREQAMAYIKENPVEYLRLGLVKEAWLVWPRFLRGEMQEIYTQKMSMQSMRNIAIVSGLSNIAIVIMGVIGFWYAPKNRFWWLSFMLVGMTFAASFFSFGDPRFRDIPDHLLIIYSASFIYQLMRERDIFSRFGKSAILVVITLLPLLSAWTWIALVQKI